MYDEHVKAYNNYRSNQMSLGLGIGSAVFGAASAIGSGISGMINNQYNKAQNEWNKAFAREQFDYQKNLNQQIMDREDTAVQRRAKDLEAAGLSKTLAAGSGAQSQVMQAGGTPAADSQTQLGKVEMKLLDSNIANQFAEIEMKKAHSGLLNSQAITELFKQGNLSAEEKRNISQAVLNGIMENYYTELANSEPSRRNMYNSIASNNRSQANLNVSKKEAQDWDNLLNSIYFSRSTDTNHPAYNAVKSWVRETGHWTAEAVKNLYNKFKGWFNSKSIYSEKDLERFMEYAKDYKVW